jgi:hypothetical protein
MARNTKVVSSLPRKTKFNILSGIFILFIIISILVSINPIVSIISKKNKIAELESNLNDIRNQNIELLALEKSLYDENFIKQEGLKQFGIADSDTKVLYKVNEVDKLKLDTELSNTLTNDEQLVYSNNNLWENLKLLYYKEIKK